MVSEIHVDEVSWCFDPGFNVRRLTKNLDHLKSIRGDAHHVLSTVFKSYPELPIRGGWGYSKKDAVIIDSSHPAAKRPFNGIDVEYTFAELRMYLELITTRPPGKRYSHCRYSRSKQKSFTDDDGRTFDVLYCDMTALPQATFDQLKAEWEGPDGFGSEGFDVASHEMRRETATVRYSREIWFDITSFYGKNL